MELRYKISINMYYYYNINYPNISYYRFSKDFLSSSIYKNRRFGIDFFQLFRVRLSDPLKKRIVNYPSGIIIKT